MEIIEAKNTTHVEISIEDLSNMLLAAERVGAAHSRVVDADLGLPPNWASRAEQSMVEARAVMSAYLRVMESRAKAVEAGESQEDIDWSVPDCPTYNEQIDIMESVRAGTTS
tara:strand:+ start:910 stop:1245 length:336 start_codon:yes stop_codon:yes gene_type:complete